ncbi:MAG: ABC transporter substrate-binding protein [Candidatus Rokubacteria bacterium]|nr:ABC transporter substrate-binding protein [Candidatus Rokubacteria bacterium]
MGRQGKWVAAFVLGLAGAVLALPGPAVGQEIKIGWIGPLSGWGAPGGTAIMRGAQLAIDHVNAGGGIDGRKLVLVTRDSEATPAKAITVARELIDREKVYALIGKYDSSSAKALNPVIHEAGTPMMLSIAAATKNIEYERNPNFMFRASGNDTFIAEFLVDFVTKELGAKRVAIGYEDTGYGFGGRDDVTKALERRGMKPVAAVKFSRPDTDMTAQALVVKGGNADVIVLYSIAKADAMMIRSLDKVGVKIPVVCAWAASSPELWQFAGPLAQGVFVMQTYSFLDPKLDDLGRKAAADFLKKHGLKDVSEMVTPAFTAHAYDGMLLLAEAMKRARPSFDPARLGEDRKKIRDALEANLGPIRGLIKTYSPAFTKDNHDSIGPEDYIMTVWNEGKLIPFKGKQDWGKKH